MKTDPSQVAFNLNKPVTIEGIDGREYHGKTAAAALQAMRRGSWGMPARDLNGYMRQVAKRVYGWNKCGIRTDSVRNFLSDMVRCGIITVRQA